jgi:hypothetical protein
MESIRQKHTKLIVWILGALLAAIWGEVGYQLLSKKDSAPVPAQFDRDSSVSPVANTDHFSFDTRVRDPFAYSNPDIKAKKRLKPVPLVVHIWTPPPVSLEGVILGDGKKTAILGGRSGNTFFLSEGDTLGGVRILRVADKEVAYRYDDKDTSWMVGR